MQYVPSLPPVSGVKERMEVLALTPSRRVKSVQLHTHPPLVVAPPHPQNDAVAKEIEAVERREDQPIMKSRRKYCRRVLHQTILEELRSVLERRHQQQRGDDTAEHIDIQV